MREFHYTVTKEDIDDGLAIRDIVKKRFTLSSRLRSKIKRNKTVFVNGQQTATWFAPREGDIITVAIPDETSYFTPEDVPIHPILEDDDLLIINKPPGYVVHPTRGHDGGTIANGVAKYMLDTNQSFKIRFINRLDMDTSGILLLGKNQLAQGELMKQMKTNGVKKTYRAIVRGILPSEAGTIDLPLAYKGEGEGIGRKVDPAGKPSVTNYRVLETFPCPGSAELALSNKITDSTENPTVVPPWEGACLDGYSLIELDLQTGRTHQIRVHMSYIGHPVVSDFLYGVLEPYLIGRQALHAYKLEFDHPVTGERLALTAPLPEDMEHVLDLLRGHLTA